MSSLQAVSGSPPSGRYAPILQALHWSIALLVAVQVILIVVLHHLQSLEFGRIILNAHRQCGAAVLILAAASLLLAVPLKRRLPATPTPAWQRTVARVIHGGLILLLIAQPVLGLLQAAARGDDLTFFGIVTIPIPSNALTDAGQLFASLHRWGAYGLLALVAAHMGAVVFNRLFRGSSGMCRMLPAMMSSRLVNRVPLAWQLALVFGAILTTTAAAGLYNAHQYVTMNALRTEFSETTLARLDDLRGAQLALRSLGGRPSSAPADAQRLRSVKAIFDGLKGEGALATPDARLAIARAQAALAGSVAQPEAAIAVADQQLQSAIDSQAMAAVLRNLEFEKIGARGHDLIILTLAPSVILAGLLALLLTRNVLIALSQARAMVRSVAQAGPGEVVHVEGHGEFAKLMRDIVEMRTAVARREQESAAQQLRQRAELEALDRRQREAEAEVRLEAAARRQAELVSQAKTEFLANMSHEIRTPLNGVLGMAQAMAHDALPPTQRKRLEVIRSSGESLLRLLNDLLDVAKIEAGMLEVETRQFDPAEAIRNACASFQAIAEEKGLAFTLSLDDGLGRCCGDVTRLRQVVSNLVSNALKFTEQGAVEVAARRSGDEVQITVSDTGLGMTPDTAARMFNKFVQADASTARRFGGTGLGLAICRDLATLMGGTISVQSELGKGACFTFKLPLPRVDDDWRSAVAAAADAPATTLRVLAADDNEVNRQVLVTLLGQVGLGVTVVSGGAEAVEAWAPGAWDVILMDIQMPVMDGQAATVEIRKREAAANCLRTPIIALTANVMTNQVDEYLAVGMDAVVAKPINVQDLFDTLEEVLSKPSQLAGANESEQLARAS